MSQRPIVRPSVFARKALGFNLYPVQEAVVDSLFKPGSRTSYLACNDAGKALAIDTPILTPSGWSTMGELKEGDFVFGSDGKPCKVTFVTEVMHGRPCNIVHFFDGSQIIADDEHLWKTLRTNVTTKGPKYYFDKKEHLATTAQIRDDLEYRLGIKCGGLRHNVPTCPPVQFCEKALPIAPYTFGAWLGDGHSHTGVITYTMPDYQIIDEIEKDGYTHRDWPDKRNGVRYAGLGNIVANPKAKGFKKSDFRIVIEELGVSRNKHIPRIYLESSISQRWALFQGLMDTDGCTDKNGRCEFTSVKINLAKDVLELALGLGFKAVMKEGNATINGRFISKKYRVCFRADGTSPVFRLKRKQERLLNCTPMTKSARSNCRAISKIERIDSVPVKCIQVDSRDHCYLAGKNLIITHNTSRCIVVLILWHLWTWPRGKVKSTSGSWIQIQDQLVPGLGRHKDKFEDEMEFFSTPMIRTTEGGFWRGFSTNEPGRAEGDHADGEECPLLCIVDEAKTVPDKIFHAFERCVSLDSDPTRYLIASSPGFAEGIFYLSQTLNKKDWQVFKQTADDTPHITKESISKVRERWNGFPAFARSMLGEDFMPLVEDAIIDLKALDFCLANPKQWIQGPKHAFCDFAWSNDGDENVLALCHGNRVTIEATFHADNLNDICSTFIRHFIRLGLHSHEISGDEGSGGKMIMDELENQGYVLNRINNQGPANDQDHYNSIAAEIWYEGSKKIYENSVIIPNDSELRGQLLSRKRIKGSKGRLSIESKRDMKKRGVPSPDRADACFSEDTDIHTLRGLVKIKDVIVGDYALTPFGYRRVVKLHHVPNREVFQVGELKGTPNHRIFIKNKGWLRMDAIVLTDTMESVYSQPIWNILSLFFTRVENIGFKPLADIIKKEHTEKLSAKDFFIESSGLNTMELFQMVSLCITKMASGGIIGFPIWSYCHWQSILECIQQVLQRRIPNGLERFSLDKRKQSFQPFIGTKVMKAGLGTETTEKHAWKNGWKTFQKINALSAEMNSKQKHSNTIIAHLNAAIGLREKETSSKEVALFAKILSLFSEMHRLEIAPKNALRLKGRRSVYNLTVEGEHCYYANGILVENCLGCMAPVGGFQQAGGGGFTMQPLRVGSYQPVGY